MNGCHARGPSHLPQSGRTASPSAHRAPRDALSDVRQLLTLADSIDPRYRSFVMLGGSAGCDSVRCSGSVGDESICCDGECTSPKRARRRRLADRFRSTEDEGGRPIGATPPLRRRRARSTRCCQRGSRPAGVPVARGLAGSSHALPAALLGTGSRRRRALSATHSRSPAYRRSALDRRRREPEADRRDGGPHVGICRARLRTPLPPTGRRTDGPP